MVNEWTRDDFAQLDIGPLADPTLVLDEVASWLNQHHPKPDSSGVDWKAMYEQAARERDAAVARAEAAEARTAPAVSRADIAARCGAATEGPWIVNGPDEDWAVLSSGSDSVIHAYSAHGICEGCECGDGAAHVAIGIEDAEFIAHARTDVPELVEAVRRRDAALRAVLDECRKIRAGNTGTDFRQGGVAAAGIVEWAINSALGEGS